MLRDEKIINIVEKSDIDIGIRIMRVINLLYLIITVKNIIKVIRSVDISKKKLLI